MGATGQAVAGDMRFRDQMQVVPLATSRCRYLWRLDKKVDAMGETLLEVRRTTTGMLQILASQDNYMLRVEERLGRIEQRLELRDPAIPDA